MLASAGLLATSCGIFNKKKLLLPSPPPPPIEKIVRKHDPGIESRFVLKPVGNSAQGVHKNYHFMYDYPNKFLMFVDIDSLYATSKTWLSDSLKLIKGKMEIHSMVFTSMVSYPFSNFTDSTAKKIAADQDIDFETINNHNIGKASNAHEETNNPIAMQMLLDMIEGNNISGGSGVTTSRILVDGAEGNLIDYPIRSILKGVNNKSYDMFFDYPNGNVFITPDPTIYEKFARVLTLKNTNNMILIQGVAIGPFIDIKDNSLQNMTQDRGLKINGDKNQANSINGLTVLRLSNMMIVYDYPEVIKWLKKELGKSDNSKIDAPKNNRQENPKPKPVSNDPNRPFNPND